MESAPDIDLSGDFDLPPGVAPGSLGGDDGPPPAEAQPGDVVDPEENPADVPWDGVIRDGSLGGDDGEEPEDDPPATDVELRGEEALSALEAEEEDDHPKHTLQRNSVFDTAAHEHLPPRGSTTTPSEDEVVDAVSTEVEVETPVKKKRQRKKAAAPENPIPANTVKSGTINRLYIINRMVEAEVDGQIVEVAVRVMFTDDSGNVMPGIRDRNRDLALAKAAKAFPAGWHGTLVATPERHWEPEPVFNEPNGGFTPRIGA